MEDLEKEKEVSTAIETESETKEEKSFEPALDDLPRLEDLLKSEQELATPKELKGVTEVKMNADTENKTFSMKKDEQKKFVRKRVKLLTTIYITVITLLLGLVGVNIFTLVGLSKQITDNTNTIQAESQTVSILQNGVQQTDTPTDSITITLNTPRDYNDDQTELSFLDKLTILIKNIFS